MEVPSKDATSTIVENQPARRAHSVAHRLGCVVVRGYSRHMRAETWHKINLRRYALFAAIVPTGNCQMNNSGGILAFHPVRTTASVPPGGEEAGKGGHARGVGKFERNGVAVSFGATSPRADVPDEGTAVEASSTPASAGEGLQGAHTYRVSMQGHPESLPYPEDESCVAAVLSRGDLLAGPAY